MSSTASSGWSSSHERRAGDLAGLETEHGRRGRAGVADRAAGLDHRDQVADVFDQRIEVLVGAAHATRRHRLAGRLGGHDQHVPGRVDLWWATIVTAEAIGSTSGPTRVSWPCHQPSAQQARQHRDHELALGRVVEQLDERRARPGGHAELVRRLSLAHSILRPVEPKAPMRSGVCDAASASTTSAGPGSELDRSAVRPLTGRGGPLDALTGQRRLVSRWRPGRVASIGRAVGPSGV